ncbi:type III secretion apparatus lipoprotein, YscJ/HrcJ family [Burkholderia thailandensis MSMB121]|uniref:type III secretion system inner membrane ring lipoprotein SctJ n=1 Tax=Burkholderia humptydooensis TaxID=430531 RepID=UPI0003280396|nr:type III secretion inner membrane ring lipoprotein SctJ [Burkholderia humptydooensis]AGK46604.1 type III secretion apparatus lipoprotein, YscJ/HrcJ family [Burkholderia thailandensis MSMB121]ATF36969.1 EscJ/YscJ/HrcJ family type III secretion inner membrane ring protein [Burkholderia thailandensis]KST74341.1 type III secretion protein SsaJ [Burkholderia humptydooensis]
MSARRTHWLGVGLLACALAGCKTELYSNLPEAEANQMLALLMLRHIDADKKVIKDGNVTIRVEPGQFVNAVELLRQNGLPARKLATMEEMFPSGQLVTSPAQEQAKIQFLKEQQLEKMLRAMDGVINAQVSVAEGAAQDRRDPEPPSAAVFVKYSPEYNFAARVPEIRSLVVTGVPNLSPERVSVVVQAADYRYAQPSVAASGVVGRFEEARLRVAGVLAALAVCAALAGAGYGWYRRMRLRGGVSS